jgi:tetratricopeptide (TPR) repeat protein
VTALIFRNPIAWTVIICCSLFLPSFVQAQTSKGSSKKSGTQSSSSKSTQSDAAFNESVKKGDEARLAGRLMDSVPYYVQALKIRPKWAEGWWYVGTILYDADKYEDARDAFHNLIGLEPQRGQAWAMLGLCQFQTHEYEPAAYSLTRGRELGLDNNKALMGVVRYHAAIVYNRFEQFEIAFDVLREFLREGNENPKIIEAFGLTMLRMPFLPSEIPADKREEVLLAGRAGFDMAARRLEDARKAFDELLTRYPKEPNVHYAFGVFLLGQDADAAIKEFQRELEISPNHVPSMLQMAFEYHKRNDYDTALPLAEKSVKLAPKMFQARNILGRVLLDLGQVDRSITELEAGAKLAPSSPEMHYALSRAYTRAGRKEDADRERDIFKELQKQAEKQANPAGNVDDKPKP